MKITKGKRSILSSKKIYAADEETEEDFGTDDFSVETDNDYDIADTIDDLADDVDDIQDSLEDVDEDDVDIELDNNIANHFVAECDRCHGIFISALIESDQDVEKITGTCPLCDKETDQYLKWIIKEV